MAAAFTLMLTLALASCGTDSHHFRIDGRLLHINQGEFYVYSPDGTLSHMDTIKVQAGRFSYEVQCDRPMTLMIVFPNFTEQPVFAQPGKSVDMKGDASHLKELTVKGTKDNELMNSFRKQVLNAAPPEMRQRARQMVEDHPESAIGSYLVNKYFVDVVDPDIKSAMRLVDLMVEHQPDNGYLKRLKRSLSAVTVAAKGSDVPSVLGSTIEGKPMGRVQLTAAPTTVVCAFASWKYESMNLLRRVCDYAATTSGSVAVVGVSIDASPQAVRTALQGQLNGMSTCPIVCDGKMVDSPFFTRLGFFSIPDNIVIRNGRIAAAHLTDDQLMEFIKVKK